MKMDYIKVVKDALKVFWRHKSLWIFGIVMTIFGHGAYSFSVSYRESYSNYSGGTFQTPSIPGRELILQILDNPVPYLIGFGILSFILWVISTLVYWWCEGALIGMVGEAAQKGSTSIGSGMASGRQHLVPLTLMGILFSIPNIILSLLGLGVGLLFISQMGGFYRSLLAGGNLPRTEIQTMLQSMSVAFTALLCLTPFLCLGGLASVILNLFNQVAARSCVGENLTFKDSIKRGWQLTRKNVGYILLNALVLWVIRVVVGFVMAIPALLLWVPTVRALMYQSWSTLAVISTVMLVIYALVMVVGGSLTSFNSTLWTKLVHAMVAKEQAASPLVPTGSPENL